MFTAEKTNMVVMCPLVSVIIPNYNHARFLDQRIQSVLNQTYQNFEVIILDDKSTDNSKEVIEKYRGNPHVAQIIYNEVNSGSTFKQWDKGIHLAKGELIWIAESDDYCENSFLEEIVDAFTSQRNIVYAYSNIVVVDAEGNRIPAFSLNYHNDSAKSGFYIGKDFIRKFLYRECCVWNASSVVFRKNMALKVAKNYQSFASSGDYLFWIEMAEMGNVVKINKNLDYFRIHNMNVTPKSKSSGIKWMEHYQIYRYLVDHKLICGLRRFESYIIHLSTMRGTIYQNSEVESQLNNLWDPHGIMTPRLVGLGIRFIDACKFIKLL